MPAILFEDKKIPFKMDGDTIILDGKKVLFTILREREGSLLVRIGNSITEIIYAENDRGIRLYSGNTPRDFEVLSDRDILLRSLESNVPSRHHHAEIKAPMPGLVVKILVKQGDTARRGTTLLILEAMKMENEIRTPVDAEVGDVLVSNGDIVEKGQVLFTLV